jgi:hypothetical protein
MRRATAFLRLRERTVCPSILAPHALESWRPFFSPQGFLIAMNSWDALLCSVQAVIPPSLFFSCVSFSTAPLRRIVADRIFTAIRVTM